MSNRADYVIVGTGLTGATIGRMLVDSGRDVLMVEKRNHVGGNVHDYQHESGIWIHTYGPHYFRTSSDKIWEFVNRFSEFERYEAVVRSLVDGRYENWPISSSYIRRTVGEEWLPAFCGTPGNFEEASLAKMPEMVYYKFVKGYTEKQWGVPASTLEAGLAGRFDVRDDDDPRLMRHKYQGIPKRGYAEFMREMLRGIPVVMNCDYIERRREIQAGKTLVYTGPIDEYFAFRLGRLGYRTQRREHEYRPDVEGYVQPCGQVNHPEAGTGGPIRTLEWKHMMPAEVARSIRGTVLTREFPATPQVPREFEYPFPSQENRSLYERYRELAEHEDRTIFCGRLGEYRYLDMDQAIGRALTIGRRLLGHPEEG